MTRLLRIEARRNAVLLMLPLLALLTVLSPLARNLAPVSLWSYRSILVQGQIQVIGPFAAGVAAWMAGREQRRSMADVLASTSRDPWSRLLATWAVTAGWAALSYVVTAAAAFGITADQATWGGPDWWPVVVGLVGVVTLTGVAFAVGRRFPSRFTAPLAAVGAFAVLALGTSTGYSGNRFGRLSPLFSSIDFQQAIFYPARSDLAIVQVVFLVGVLTAALGLLALREHERKPVVAAMLVVGLALAGIGVGLAASSRTDARGVVVPALHSAATDRPVPFTPACDTAPLPVCVHPAYAEELPVLSSVVNDIAAPVLGAPGAPTGVRPVAGESKADVAVHGEPPVLDMPAIAIRGDSLQPDYVASAVETQIALALVGAHGPAATPPQRVIARYLLDQAHDTPSGSSGLTDRTVADAAHRFAALSPTARTAWFHAHLAGLMAGHVTTEDLP